MTTHYPQRKKKLHKPILSQRLKIVRIDSKTEIEVSVSLSNEEAIERYYQKHTNAIRPSEASRMPIPKNEYKCACCGNIYEMGRTEEEARQECLDNFGELALLDNLEIVCDDCYNKMNPKEHPEELKQARKEFYKNHQ